MKTQMVDYTEEKIALAKEVGLDKCANAMLADKAAKEQARQEVELLTKLKFKPINLNQIDRMLNKRVFRFMYHEDAKAFCQGTLFIGGLGGFIIGGFWCACLSPFKDAHAVFMAFLPMMIVAGATVVIAFGAFLVASLPKTITRGMPLVSWEEPLPRGALLAVKEAKEAGIGEFSIYYPTLEDRRSAPQRVVNADPVIVGKKPGMKFILMIHAWDDGKVKD